MRTDSWLPLMKRVGGMRLVIMSSQPRYSPPGTAPALITGRVITIKAASLEKSLVTCNTNVKESF